MKYFVKFNFEVLANERDYMLIPEKELNRNLENFKQLEKIKDLKEYNKISFKLKDGLYDLENDCIQSIYEVEILNLSLSQIKELYEDYLKDNGLKIYKNKIGKVFEEGKSFETFEDFLDFNSYDLEETEHKNQKKYSI